MKFAFLGIDDLAYRLARAIDADPRHRVAAWVADGQPEADWSRLTASATPLADWQELLQHQLADVVVVASSVSEHDRLEPLRRLAQQAIPVITAHPVVVSMLLYYELDMIRRDTGAPLLAFAPSRWHPATHRLLELTDGDAPLAAANQLVVERRIISPSRQSTLAAFIADIALARSLFRDLNEIVAMSPAADADYRNLGVQLAGASGSMVHWSAVPLAKPSPNQQPGATLTLRAPRGTATLTTYDDDTAWNLAIQSDDGDTSATYPDFDAAAESIRRIERLIDHPDDAGDWPLAAQDVEIAASISRSLEKGRKVELFAEDYSEEGTFKGTMAWVGCALLMIIACTIPIASIAEEIGIPLAHYVPHVAFAILAVFLLMQSLRFVFPANTTPPVEPTNESTPK